MKTKLNIVIVSFNTKSLLDDCLESLFKLTKEIKFDVIVSENGSDDGSVDLVEKKYPQVILIQNNKNLGFAAGNNAAKVKVDAEFVLFLNSDTKVPANTLKECLKYLETNSDVGAMTCKLVLPSGELDHDARRSFPTPWVSLTHFSGLDKLFPKSPLFARYWYGYKDPNAIHEIDSLQGAFFLSRKKLLDQVGWFDEHYFLDAEDIDLCFRLKKNGYKIVYYPKVSIIHIKKASKRNEKSSSVVSGLKAMEFFYRKNFWSEYPLFINYAVLVGIRSLWLIRVLKVKLGL